MRNGLVFAALALGFPLAACADAAQHDGGVVTIAVAPLSLPGVGIACYDLRVENGAGIVWERGNPSLTLLGADQAGGASGGAPDTATLCSSSYGSGAGGDISYVATCDSDSDSDALTAGVQNDVTIWVDGLYDSGATADLADWRDPCPSGCTLTADCQPNADTAVTFDLNIMRRAQQGFFDIAVSFSDLFCSAKLDTCSDDGDDADALPDPIRLVFGDDADRDWTGVIGFACTAGPDATQTELMYGQVRISCGSDLFILEPGGPPGNATAEDGGYTLHYNVFRGLEELTCGAGSCRKLYWNLAFSLDDLQSFGGSCDIAFEATASDDGAGFTDGLPDASVGSYPYLVFDASLTTSGVASCQQNGLDDVGSAVVTAYRGTLAGLETPLGMCSIFDGASVTTTTADDCAPPITLLSIPADTQNYSVYTAAGAPTAPSDYVVTIDAAVVVSATSTAVPAFSTGNLPAGSTVTLVNHGYVLGRGGNGSAGTKCTNTVGGGDGGPAVEARVPLTIDNTDGNIWGGGGGGSGSAGDCGGNHFGGSGGGGAGGGLGAAGHPSYPSSPGTTGPSGNRGTGSYGSWGGGLGYNTRGGNGGAYGVDGTRGSNYSGSWGNQPGGSAGASVKTNAQPITWLGGNTASRVKGPID